MKKQSLEFSDLPKLKQPVTAWPGLPIPEPLSILWTTPGLVKINIMHIRCVPQSLTYVKHSINGSYYYVLGQLGREVLIEKCCVNWVLQWMNCSGEVGLQLEAWGREGLRRNWTKAVEMRMAKRMDLRHHVCFCKMPSELRQQVPWWTQIFENGASQNLFIKIACKDVS